MSSPDPLSVALETGASVTALVYGASAASATPTLTLILGHGAGANQKSAFMVQFASALAVLGVNTITFNFPYTEQGRRLPDRRPVLESCYRSVVEAVRQQVSVTGSVFVGGKSMGGRIATHIAAADQSLPLAGLVLLGYPLHPPGRPHERRDAHLPDVKRPMLIVQGSRDTFGTPAELDTVLERMTPRPTIHVIEGGDHSFKVPKTGKGGGASVYAGIQRTIVDWMLTV